jgi:probable HAF family extracellular repeat protein
MRPLAIFCLAGAIVFLAGTHGCGGSGGGGANGRAVFKVLWPAPSRLIPLAANSIKIEIRRGANVVGTQVVVRPPQGGQGTANFDTLPVASLTATATAYPNPDGTGTAQATASVILQTVSGQVVPVNLTMASTITQVDLSPSQAAIDVGQSINLAVSPKDSAGNVVLVSPSALSFAVSDGLVAGVDSAGKLTGNGVGSAIITVTDTESGKSATMSVNVAPAGTGSGTPTPVKVTINWAARSRALSAPASALSAVITLKGAATNGGDFSFTVDRNPAPDAYSADYTSPSSARSGYWVLDVKFYAQAGGAGAVVGTAGAGVTIKSDGTGIGNIDTVGKVASVSVPAGQKLKIGQKVDLVFSARDAQGNVLAVTPGSAFWQVMSGQSALKFTNGQAEGLDAGTASVTASVDNHTSAVADVEVDCPLPLSYTVTDLGPSSTLAMALSSNGMVAGFSAFATPRSDAFVWQNGVMTDLGTLPGGGGPTGGSEGFAINSNGVVVGYSAHDGLVDGIYNHAFIYQNGTMTDLGTFGGTWSYARGINDAGQVVGDATIDSGAGSITHAFLWQNGTMTRLDGPNDPPSIAYAINNAGQVLIQSSGNTIGTYIWQNGAKQDVQGLGFDAHGYAINDKGHVAGESRSSNGSLEHPFVNKNGVVTDLGLLPGGDRGRAWAINNLGSIVGYSWPNPGTNQSHAFLYCGGVMHDLNVLAPVSGWRLTQGRGINDAGQIICVAVRWDEQSGNYDHAFLLTPNP